MSPASRRSRSAGSAGSACSTSRACGPGTRTRPSCWRSWPTLDEDARRHRAAAGGLRRADQAGADRRAGPRDARRAACTVAVRVSPQHTLALAPVILDAGVDLLVIQGTLVSAEHVSTVDEPLNLKEFIADLDLPVIVGGCTNYQTALHLMRTGAAGVIVGIGADELVHHRHGARHPGADGHRDRRRRRGPPRLPRRDRRPVRAPDRRRRHPHLRRHRQGARLRRRRGHARRAAVAAPRRPAGGAWWHSAASHPKLPRGAFGVAERAARLAGAAALRPGRRPRRPLNLFGGLRRAMAKCGYRDLKEFQKVGLVLDR